jgi:AbrB family looped-hinge helix DNA binding protein
MTYNRSKVGQKGQVVIPKVIRDKAGIRAGSEVLVEMRGNDEVVIKRSSPPTKSYVDYYIASYSKKLKRAMNIKKVIEEEAIERTRIH